MFYVLLCVVTAGDCSVGEADPIASLGWALKATAAPGDNSPIRGACLVQPYSLPFTSWAFRGEFHPKKRVFSTNSKPAGFPFLPLSL